MFFIFKFKYYRFMIIMITIYLKIKIGGELRLMFSRTILRINKFTLTTK